jgi:mevalonate kinase
VHGSYAVAAAINKRATVTVSQTEGNYSTIESKGQVEKLLDDHGSFSAARSVAKKIFEEYGVPKESIKLKVESEIPLGSGLGSSAAISVATAAALSKFLGRDLTSEKISEIAAVGEKTVHGNPSGIDTEASLHGGMILYSRNTGSKAVPLNRALQIIVVYSGCPRNTSELVEKVSKKRIEFPSTFAYLSNALSFATLQFIDALNAGDLPYLGALMNLDQAALSWIGASAEVLDRLIEDVLFDESCFGAKLTGAGGGGSIIALPKPDRAEKLLDRVSGKYPLAFTSSIPQDGLRCD